MISRHLTNQHAQALRSLTSIYKLRLPPIQNPFPPPRHLPPLRQRPNPGINPKPLPIQPRQLVPQLLQRYSKSLNKLILLQLRLRVLVARISHIDMHKQHLRVRIAEPRIIPHEKALGVGLGRDGGVVAGLFAELAEGGGGDAFTGVDQAAGDFNRDAV
jgi:hypothetical protein